MHSVIVKETGIHKLAIHAKETINEESAATSCGRRRTGAIRTYGKNKRKLVGKNKNKYVKYETIKQMLRINEWRISCLRRMENQIRSGGRGTTRPAKCIASASAKSFASDASRNARRTSCTRLRRSRRASERSNSYVAVNADPVWTLRA